MSARRNLREIDLAKTTLREANVTLRQRVTDGDEGAFRLLNPKGTHALACGLDAPVHVEISGHVGYYCAGMNKEATVLVNGNAGQGVAENMMSGQVHMKGDASQSAGATAHGGLLVIDGRVLRLTGKRARAR